MGIFQIFSIKLPVSSIKLQFLPSHQTQFSDRNMLLKVLILHAPDDTAEVTSFLRQVEEIMSDYILDITLFSDDKNIDKFNDIVKETHIVLVFMTETLCTRHWVNYNNTVTVNSMLSGNGPAILVPIFTATRAQAKFKVPLGLNCLKGLRYCDQDEFYRRSVRRTLIGVLEQQGSAS